MEKPKPGLVDALIAFLLATAVTAITFPFSDRLIRVISALWRSGFDISTVPDSWWSYSSGFGIEEVFIVWIVFMILTAIPYASCIAIVRQYRLLRWFDFVGCGVVTAVLGCGLFIGVLILMESSGFKWQFLLECFQVLLEALPHCLTCGLVAGGMCWMYFRYRGIEER